MNFFNENLEINNNIETNDQPLPGTHDLEIFRSGLKDDTLGNHPYIELKYLFFSLNAVVLLIILILVSIIINSVYFVKYSPIKKRRNQIFQEYFKTCLQDGIKYNDYDKLKNDLENLMKNIEKKEKNTTKKCKDCKVVKNVIRPRQQPIITMNEEKLVEVFHALAKMSNNMNDIKMGNDGKKRGVVMIGENETVCILNNENDCEKKNKKSSSTKKSKKDISNSKSK